MSLQKHKKHRHIERYESDRSPLAQKPTQSKLAELAGFKKNDLKSILSNKDSYIVRRSIDKNGKTRNLAYPVGKLRRAHERLKFHCGKIKHAPYLYSPRTGRAQRDNAALHSLQNQYLTLDLRQFYPSTTREHIFRWAKYDMGMFDDVAGLFTELVTVDDAISFGSPLTPVLADLVHRKMFDAIEAECKRRGLRISVWVDDIVISGKFIPGEVLNAVRSSIRENGLRSHKIKYKTGNRAVVITGIPIIGNKIEAPKFVRIKITELYSELRNQSDDPGEYITIDKLLSALGTYRYIVGKGTKQGIKAEAKMAALRRRRSKILLQFTTPADQMVPIDDDAEAPFSTD